MSRHFPQVGGLWFSPLMVGHLCSCTAMVMVCAGLAPPAPTLLSTLLVVCATPIGLCAALNLFLGGLLCASRLVQWYVFGKLRVAEWQRLWDRLLNYSMGQLVILGAVVEPDVGELLLWTAFSAAVGVLSVSSGLCRDRLEYMCHCRRARRRGAARVIGLQVALGGGALGLACGVTALLRDAGASALSLFLFQCALLVVDCCHTIVQWYLRRREAVAASDAASDALYYSVLLPELWLGLCRLCHHLHVWYVHGISFSVIDVLLLANTKARDPARPPAAPARPPASPAPSAPPTPPPLSRHRRHSRRYANGSSRTRTFASPTPTCSVGTARRRKRSWKALTTAAPSAERRWRTGRYAPAPASCSCSSSARRPSPASLPPQVLPCGHIFHYRCLRAWLEQSHTCPTCRAPLLGAHAHAARLGGGCRGGGGGGGRRPRRGGEHAVAAGGSADDAALPAFWMLAGAPRPRACMRWRRARRTSSGRARRRSTRARRARGRGRGRGRGGGGRGGG